MKTTECKKNLKCQKRRSTMVMSARQIGHRLPIPSRCRIHDSQNRGAGVSACFVVRWFAVRIRWFGIQIAAVCSHAVAHRFQKFESIVDVVVEPTETGSTTTSSRNIIRVSLMMYLRFFARRIVIPRLRRLTSAWLSTVVRCRWPRYANMFGGTLWFFAVKRHETSPLNCWSLKGYPAQTVWKGGR